MFNANEEIIKLKNILGMTLNFHDNPERKYIYLDSIISPNKGGGFGTKAMKCLVQLSQEKGYGGRVDLAASYSSHLYHLYMGMIPFERKLDYVSVHYGLLGKRALKKFAEYKSESDLQNMGTYGINALKSMLSNETTIKKDEITPSILIKNQELLLNLNNKECSYLKEVFIPEILEVLESNFGEKYPDTSDFTSIKMTLSEEGKARWLKAIKDDTPFEAFKNFEHLRPYMTNEQIDELDKLLTQNRLAMSSKENQKQSSSIQEVVTTEVVKLVQTEMTLSKEENYLIDTNINNNSIIEKQDVISVSNETEEKSSKISESGLGLFNNKQNELEMKHSIDTNINISTIIEKQEVTSISSEEKSPKISVSGFSLFNKKQDDNDNVTVLKKKTFCLIL